MYVALVAAMTTIELAYNKGWFQLWLKCDSSLVVSTFKTSFMEAESEMGELLGSFEIYQV